MPLFINQGRTIFFVHVPKTGGSSVEDYLVRRFGPMILADVNKREGVKGTGLIVASTHLSAVDLREMIPPDCHYAFAVVRDPLERLMSEYRWQTGASRMSKFSFSTWLRIMMHCIRIDARAYGNHIRPQSDLVPDDVTVFRMEDGLDRIIAPLDKVAQSTESGLQIGHLKKRQTGENSMAVSRQDVALVYSVYAADYARFGYARQDPATYPNDRKAAVRNMMGATLAQAVMIKQRHDWLR